VTEAAKKLLSEFLALTDEEREAFLDAATRSLDHGHDLSAAWKSEVQSRIADLESGRVRPVPGHEVEAEILRVLDRR
jgi:putative addiction module component (TIGR02574 family)